MRSSDAFRVILEQLPGWGSSAYRPLLIAVAYYVGAEAAFLVGTLSDMIFAPFWPPNVILFCALVFVPYQRWWLYIAAVFPAHVIAELGVGMAWPQLLVAFATNCAVAVLNALGTGYFLGNPPWFDNFRKTMLYGIITAIASPALVALGGALVRSDGVGSLDDYWTFWAQWYAANALGSLTLGPVLLTWFGERSGRSHSSSDQRMVEKLLLSIGLVLTSIVTFKLGFWAPRGFLPAILCLPLPVVLWAAVRFQARGASAAILAIAVISIWLTLNGATIFVDADAEHSVLALQLFITGLSIPVLLLGAAIDGLLHAEQTTAALARFVLGAQDAERRQVAKNLHDRVAQDLAAANWMNEDIRKKLPEEDRPAAKHLDDVLRQSVQDLRTVSYLLHPPLLDDAGLGVALRSLVDGWSQQTGLAIALDVPETLGRLSSDIELTIFRLVEDALANIEEHSDSATTRVRVNRTDPPIGVLITVEDVGKGMPPVSRLRTIIRDIIPVASARGLALARMRERVLRIGGKFEIMSGVGKTTIEAKIPITELQCISDQNHELPG